VPRGRTVGSDVARYGEHDPRRLCRTVAGCRWPGSVGGEHRACEAAARCCGL